MTIGPNTRLAALLGNPVEHSFSPIIHNTAYQILGLDALYLARSVAEEALSEAVAGMNALGFMGASVTIPYKQRVIRYVDSLTAEAAAIGAVNTLVFRTQDGERRIVGDNTDVTGFLAPLRPHRAALQGREFVILGAGGAARAVSFGALTSLGPSRITIVSRRREQGATLVEDLEAHAEGTRMSVLPFSSAAETVAEASLVVNVTPLGMYPDVQETPWPDTDCFHRGQVVYDLVYNPVRTRLLEEASARGSITINGIEMLIGQAAAAHTTWTGTRMPVDEVREVLLKAVGG